MTRKCCVPACPSSHKTAGVTFYLFPKTLNSMVSISRVHKWLEALRFRSTYKTKHKYVCSNHFVSGMPAKFTDTNDIDWIPSVNMPEAKRCSVVSDIINTISYDLTDTNFTPLMESSRHNIAPSSSSIDENHNELSSFQHSTMQCTNIDSENMENVSCCSGTGLCESARNYEQELNRLQAQNNSLLAEVAHGKRDMSWIQTDQMCKRYTGINEKATLQRLFDFVEPAMFQPACHLTKGQVFVMTLRKLRRNTPFSELADEYSVCTTTVSKYFHRTVVVLYESLKYALEIPSQEVSIRHNPRIFQQHYGSRRVFILDCFEIYTETPLENRAAIAHRSAYKTCQTTKFMIAMNCNGSVAFISHAYGGRCSDRFIIQNCGFLDMIQPNDVILADKGFDIHDLITAKGATLNIPTFLRKNTQLNPLHIETDKQITCLRVHVERLIGVLKQKYTYLKGPITIDALRRFENNLNLLDITIRVVCIFINFNRSIVPF